MCNLAEVFMYNVSLNGSESAGSVAYRMNNQAYPQTPKYSNMNFRGRDDYYEERGSKGLKVLLGLAGATVLVIGGLGIAHKKDVLSKISNEKVKNILSKAKPAAETCYKWCHKVKKTLVNNWDKIKKMFNKKS